MTECGVIGNCFTGIPSLYLNNAIKSFNLTYFSFYYVFTFFFLSVVRCSLLLLLSLRRLLCQSFRFRSILISLLTIARGNRTVFLFLLLSFCFFYIFGVAFCVQFILDTLLMSHWVDAVHLWTHQQIPICRFPFTMSYLFSTLTQPISRFVFWVIVFDRIRLDVNRFLNWFHLDIDGMIREAKITKITKQHPNKGKISNFSKSAAIWVARDIENLLFRFSSVVFFIRIYLFIFDSPFASRFSMHFSRSLVFARWR